MANPTKEFNLQVKISNKEILAIALPISAAIVVPQINFIINNIFLGGLGLQSLALAGITGVYYLIFAVIGHGLNNGLQALIARRAGENKIEAIGNLFSQGLRIALVFAFLGIIITWLIAPTILRFSLHDEANVKVCVDFLNIRILGLPFLYLYQMRNALLVGTNQSKLLIYGTATEAIVNVFFDYSMIYGKLGFAPLGFIGAAYASILSEIAGFLVIFIIIKKNGITKQLQLFKNWAFDLANTKLILQQSSPLILQHAISIISWEFFYILIEHHGQRDLAISNTMRNIFGFFGCFTWAFAATTNTMVSNVIGQKQYKRVPILINRIMKLSVGFAIFICILLNLFPQAYLNLYGQGEDFNQASIPVIRIVSSALVLMSASVIWLNAVTGTGNSKMNLITEFVAIIFYCIYVYLVLEVFQLSIVWGWASEWIYWTTLMLPSIWYMKSGKWKSKII